jgi:hypothetical protein
MNTLSKAISSSLFALAFSSLGLAAGWYSEHKNQAYALTPCGIATKRLGALLMLRSTSLT